MPHTDTDQADKTVSSKPGRSSFLIAGVMIAGFSIIFSFLVAEIGFRVAFNVPVFEVSDWRLIGIRTKRIGDRAMTDPKLGWTLKTNYRSPRFNTIDLGIRRNGAEAALREGHVLAVGDSFTEGFDEVTDEGTWPAHLETILKRPVVNAGVAGYAADQILMRANDLLPVVKPEILILGFTEVDIYRSALSDAGAPKPYFTIENDKLVYHPPAPLIPSDAAESATGSAVRSVLGYSALADYLLKRLTPNFWYPKEASAYKEVNNQPIKIICRLLSDIKTKADAQNTRTLLFMQYAGELVLEEAEIVPDMRSVTQCAREAGVEVVDQFQSLRAATNSNAKKVAEYYVLHGEEFGHMSSNGNLHAARLLADALQGKTNITASEPDTDKPLQN